MWDYRGHYEASTQYGSDFKKFPCRKRLFSVTCTNLLLPLSKFIRKRCSVEEWLFLQWRTMMFSEFLRNVWYSDPCLYTTVTRQAVVMVTPAVRPTASKRNLSVYFALILCLRRQIFNVECQRSVFRLLRPKLTEDQSKWNVFLKSNIILKSTNFDPRTDRTIFWNVKLWSDLEKGGWVFVLRIRRGKLILVIINTTCIILRRMTITWS